jgi:NADH-quinone oxidoreductase subunit H
MLFVLAGSQVAAFLERKITARMENRIGPPLLQPLYDIIKLAVKENRSPDAGQKSLYVFFPLLGLGSAVCFAFLVWQSVFSPSSGFKGDFFIWIILSAAASLMHVFGVFLFRNGSLSGGKYRLFNFFLTAELPFFIAAGVPFLQAGGAFRISELAAYQKTYGAAVTTASGFLAFATVFIASFAKIRLSPFDLPDTGIQSLSGPLTRSSGSSLALFILTRQVLLFTVPAMLVLFFLNGMPFEEFFGFLSAGKYLAVFTAFVFLRNLTPRLGLSKALRFYLGPLTFFAVCAVTLSFLGW